MRLRPLLTLSALLAAGCGTPGGAADAGPVDAGPAPLCTDATPVTCSAFVTTELRLKTAASTRLIDNKPEAGGFASHIDATAGGLDMNTLTPKEGFVYARFTEQGLEKVELSDAQALSSMDWDIAFRRYVLRINSADSGPSCTQAARVKAGTTYDALTAVPSDAIYHTDDYVTPDCQTLETDGTQMAAPATTLGGFYSYVSAGGAMGCVKMTGAVYVVALANGRHVKLTVTSYYEPTVQEQCNTSGTIPTSNTGSGDVRMRWAFLD